MKNQPDWPPGVVEELLGAVETRNYLANHFPREYFVVRPSEEAREEAAETLGNVSSRLDDLQEALDQHLNAVGVPDVDELDQKAIAGLDELRPTHWLKAHE